MEKPTGVAGWQERGSWRFEIVSARPRAAEISKPPALALGKNRLALPAIHAIISRQVANIGPERNLNGAAADVPRVQTES